jgi:hypothetical protein
VRILFITGLLVHPFIELAFKSANVFWSQRVVWPEIAYQQGKCYQHLQTEIRLLQRQVQICWKRTAKTGSGVFFAWCLNTWYLSNTAVNTLLVFCLRTNIISYTFRSAVRIQVSAHLHMTFDNTYTALVLASIVNLRCCGKVNLRSECKEKMTPNLGRFGRLLGLPVFTFFN